MKKSDLRGGWCEHAIMGKSGCGSGSWEHAVIRILAKDQSDENDSQQVHKTLRGRLNSVYMPTVTGRASCITFALYPVWNVMSISQNWKGPSSWVDTISMLRSLFLPTMISSTGYITENLISWKKLLIVIIIAPSYRLIREMTWSQCKEKSINNRIK